MSEIEELREALDKAVALLLDREKMIEHLKQLNQLRLDAISYMWAGCLAQGVDLGPELTTMLKGQIGEERVASVVGNILKPTLNREQRRKTRR